MADEQHPRLPVLPAITHVELVRVQPGDVLACTCPGRLNDEQHDQLSKQLSELFPGVRVAVLEGDMTLAVIRAEEVSR